MKNNWQKIKLHEIANCIIDRIDDPKQSNTNNYVGLAHIDSDEIKISRIGDINTVVSSKFRFKKGNILFGRR